MTFPKGIMRHPVVLALLSSERAALNKKRKSILQQTPATNKAAADQTRRVADIDRQLADLQRIECPDA